MDPNGTQLEPDLSQQDTPCLIVEDSQAESVLSDDDPEQSYRHLQARCLSNLQPRTESPVLELTACPQAAKTSVGDDEEPTDWQEMSHKGSSLVVPGAMETAEGQRSDEQPIPSTEGLLRPSGQTRQVASTPDSGCTSQAGFGLLELSESQGSDPEISANKTSGSVRGPEEINIEPSSIPSEEADTEANVRPATGLQTGDKTGTAASHSTGRSEVTSSVPAASCQEKLGDAKEMTAHFLMPSGLRIEEPPSNPDPGHSEIAPSKEEALEPTPS
ncbi:hypothetical protein scyTo_0021914, partial [Scyliorhinus torazame]|nr:hypothetical protein [Scyliorhinus torazame]